MRFDFPYLWGKSGTTEGRAGDEGQVIVDQLHPSLYHAGENGRVFTSTTTPLGLAVPIYTTTAPVGNVLWNPLGSGVKAVLLEYSWAYVSGAGVNFAIGMYARNGMGSQIATAAAFTAFAETNPVNGHLGIVNAVSGTGGGPASKVKSSNAGTVTLTAGGAAGELVQVVGFANQLLSALAQGTVAALFTYDFKGRIQVYPGTAIWFAANVASVALVAQSLVWEEMDI